MRRLYKRYRVFGRYWDNRIEDLVYGSNAKAKSNTWFIATIAFAVPYFVWQVMR